MYQAIAQTSNFGLPVESASAPAIRPEILSYHFSATSVAIMSESRHSLKLSGSSSFNYICDTLSPKPSYRKLPPKFNYRELNRLRDDYRQNVLLAEAYLKTFGKLPSLSFRNTVDCQESEIRRLVSQPAVTVVKQRSYRLRKTFVRRKALAFARLSQSKHFLGFITVTFPNRLPSSLVYKSLHLWLTNLRNNYGLKHYLGICEYQQNGATHFHLLVNKRFDIRRINRAMAICIKNIIGISSEYWGNSSVDKYNGVDIRTPFSRKQSYIDKFGKTKWKTVGIKSFNLDYATNWTVMYLTKYISKSESSHSHRCFFCSRSVSAMFTSMSVNTSNPIMEILLDSFKKMECLVITTPYCTLALPLKILDSTFLSLLDTLNNYIYSILSNSVPFKESLYMPVSIVQAGGHSVPTACTIDTGVYPVVSK